MEESVNGNVEAVESSKGGKVLQPSKNTLSETSKSELQSEGNCAKTGTGESRKTQNLQTQFIQVEGCESTAA